MKKNTFLGCLEKKKNLSNSFVKLLMDLVCGAKIWNGKSGILWSQSLNLAVLVKIHPDLANVSENLI